MGHILLIWSLARAHTHKHKHKLFMAYFWSFLYVLCFFSSVVPLFFFFLLLFWCHWCFFIFPFSLLLIVKSLMRSLWTRGRTFTSTHHNTLIDIFLSPCGSFLFSPNLSSIRSHLFPFLTCLPNSSRACLWSSRPSQSAVGLLTRVAAQEFPFSLSVSAWTSSPQSHRQ